MAVADPDLDRFRHDLAALIGVPVSDVGMLPDEDHLEGGGYHCGRKDLVKIGKFHPPAAAHIGSGTEDYSVRQLRDRNTVDERAAAVDEPDGWGHGGNTAWVKSNNMILAAMQSGDAGLAALRAMNFTPDGKVKRRYDTNSRSAGVIASTDTVLWHTHWEFWRDTLGTPVLKRTLARLLVIIRAAIEGRPVPLEGNDDDMGATVIGRDINRWDPNGVKNQVQNINTGIVDGGAADDRKAWFNVCNDTFGEPYALRLFTTTGDGSYQEFKLDSAVKDGVKYLGGGINLIRSGVRASAMVPAGTTDISAARMVIRADGSIVWPSPGEKPYDGHLGYSIERGAVGA